MLNGSYTVSNILQNLAELHDDEVFVEDLFVDDSSYTLERFSGFIETIRSDMKLSDLNMSPSAYLELRPRVLSKLIVKVLVVAVRHIEAGGKAEDLLSFHYPNAIFGVFFFAGDRSDEYIMRLEACFDVGGWGAICEAVQLILDAEMQEMGFRQLDYMENFKKYAKEHLIVQNT